MEIIFPGAAGDGTGFNISHVDPIPGKMSQHPVQRTRPMFQIYGQGNFIRLRRNFFFLADNDKPGVIALVGIDALLQDLQLGRPPLLPYSLSF